MKLSEVHRTGKAGSETRNGIEGLRDKKDVGENMEINKKHRNSGRRT
jgi:hypothetical protein